MKKQMIAGVLLAGIAGLVFAAQNKGTQKGQNVPKMPMMPMAVMGW